MSLRPFFRGFWDEPWEGMTHPLRLYDQHLGSIVPEDFFHTPRMVSRGMFGPTGFATSVPVQQQAGIAEVVNNDKEFKVSMDMQHFKPEELCIKTKDNRLIVNARHEERPDEHGFITREFTRQYVLPKDVDPATVVSSLNREGVLTLKAPKLALEAPKERMIPITQEKED